MSKRLLESQPYFVASSVGDWRESVYVSSQSRPRRIAGRHVSAYWVRDVGS
jgi:hypothetical protein